jgi:hypothetical protein
VQKLFVEIVNACIYYNDQHAKNMFTTIREDHDAFELLISRAALKATMRKRSAYKTDMQALTDKVLGL